jgi:hypothetical protein
LNVIIKPPLFIGGLPDPRTYGHRQEAKKDQHNKPKLRTPLYRLPQSDLDIRSLNNSIA